MQAIQPAARTPGRARARLGPGDPPIIALCRDRPRVRDLLLATLFAALTALGALFSLRLPFTPVPVTGQLFFVLLAGGLLGSRLGALSQLEYLALGAMGLPVFAGGGRTPLAFLGPSGGYLVAFPLAAFLMGWLIERTGWRSPVYTFLAGLAAIAVSYLGGVCWLVPGAALLARGWSPAPSLAASWAQVEGGAGLGALRLAVTLGVYPFLGVDLAKNLLATAIIHRAQRTADRRP